MDNLDDVLRVARVVKTMDSYERQAAEKAVLMELVQRAYAGTPLASQAEAIIGLLRNHWNWADFATLQRRFSAPQVDPTGYTLRYEYLNYNSEYPRSEGDIEGAKAVTQPDQSGWSLVRFDTPIVHGPFDLSNDDYSMQGFEVYWRGQKVGELDWPPPQLEHHDPDSLSLTVSAISLWLRWDGEQVVEVAWQRP